MEHLIMKKLLLALLLLCCATMAQRAGSWRIDDAKTSAIAIYYKGRKLVSQISLFGFKPDYSGGTFSMDNASASRNGNSFVWRKKNANATAVLTIDFDGPVMNLDLELAAQPVGPFEFGLYIPIKSFMVESGNIYCRADNRAVEIDDSVFSAASCTKLSFDIEQQRHIVEKLMPQKEVYFALQDKRSVSAGAVRWIASCNSRCSDPRSYHVKLRWTVQEFDAKTTADRKLRMKMPVMLSTAVKIANSGFEDGFNGWGHPTKSSLDTENPAAGHHSARLTVDDPLSDDVYITRLIPIKPGAWYNAECMLKTRGVLPALGKMPAVGAGLIVEWADPKGIWLSPGAYACEVYGDKDWHQQRLRMLRAPLNAGYASIFLALRGKGTAWFDDFKMTQIERSVEKISPSMGATVNSNVPQLEWLYAQGVDKYRVELSRKDDFPVGETIVYEIETVNHMILPAPLDKGRWHWRVLAPGMVDRQPWFFTQTVAKDVDCMPPSIEAHHSRVLKPMAPVMVTAVDNSGATPVLTVSGPSAKRYIVTNKGRGNFAIKPVGGWNKGLNSLVVTAEDANGNRSQSPFWVLFAPKPEKTIVIDANGHYAENGNVIFPLGIYEVDPIDMKNIQRDGFEVVHTYRWEGSQDDDAALKYLDACQANGLRAFIGFDRGGSNGNGIVQGNFEHVAKRVGALASHPALFCWYLFDEPEIQNQYVPPGLLIRFAELVRSLDPYHPVVMTTWGDGMNKYRKTWDTHWTQSYAKPAEIVKTIASHRQLLLNNSPITLLVHCYDQKQSQLKKAKQPVDFEKFEPDGDWMRSAAFVGITKEVNGLWWWWYAPRTENFLTAAQVPKAWEALKQVVSEIRVIRPMLVANGTTQAGTVEDSGCKIEWWAKKTQGKSLLIIVNTGEKEAQATISPAGFPSVKVKLGRFGVKVISN